MNVFLSHEETGSAMFRRAIAVHGIVQGVGFRPFVYGLATRLRLAGFVRNQVGGIWIEVEGDGPSLDLFLTELTAKPPPLARIDQLTWEHRLPLGERIFRIQSSERDGPGPIFFSPDVATCPDCLAELFHPADRRYRYPFINCTNCGPRLTIITGAPYDRPRTTMAGFRMCPACRAEYEDPANRRFHAQPTCCPACGPHLQVLDAEGRVIETADPLAYFAAALRAGRIGAVKGLGGYHLACDACSPAPVAELRRRKHRDEKPFAVMVPDIAAAEALCEVQPAERDLLLSSRRPIVLLRKRSSRNDERGMRNGENQTFHSSFCASRSSIAGEIAPGNPFLGIMLPYTPLHHLLLQAVAGTPLVMTSGNRSDEPIAYEDADALQRLGGIADLFLTHNRPIHVRCDDSVSRCLEGAEQPLRRSRGYAPEPLPLPMACPAPILAVGGQLKATFALSRDRHAFLSHHLGDLDHYDVYRAFVKDIALYQDLFSIQPQVIAHDLHPDYAATRYALDRAKVGVPPSGGPRLIAVQHHHAHMASCMAENGLVEQVIGVSFDGTGYGTDGAIWGGEFLVGDYRQFRRAAHLGYVGMPGGDRAIREPWRMALAHLVDAGCSANLLEDRLPAVSVRGIHKMLERGLQTPMTSSAGRLFDAVAALAGVRHRVSFEGQAAMELEWLAGGVQSAGSYPFEITPAGAIKDAPLIIDTRPLIQAVAGETARKIDAALIARRFHTTLVEMIVAVCGRIRIATGLQAVVLSGGVFMNVLLTTEASARLAGEGFRVYRHRLVPPNDGGLSLGQLAVAACL